MSAVSKIQWTDRTWNPVRGCSIVSPGCVNCYAMKQAHRFSGQGQAYEGLTKLTKAGPQWTGLIRVEPARWKKPQRVFVNSMSDLFHERVPLQVVDQIFAVMAWCSQHTFQILTKRPARMRDYARELAGLEPKWRAHRLASALGFGGKFSQSTTADLQWPLPNVWLGVSAEDQQRAYERIPLLLQTPAAVRFVSAEPLLGPIDLEAVPLPGGAEKWYGLKGVAQPIGEKDSEPDDWKYWTRRESRLDWVIVGGESGSRARPCDVEWIRSIVAQCRSASVPVFVKQLGSEAYREADRAEVTPHAVFGDEVLRYSEPEELDLNDSKGGDPAEWPEDLRVRQFPLQD
jgi:protein gp37